MRFSIVSITILVYIANGHSRKCQWFAIHLRCQMCWQFSAFRVPTKTSDPRTLDEMVF